MSLKDIKTLSLKEAYKLYKEIGLAFIIKDGQMKGFTK